MGVGQTPTGLGPAMVAEGSMCLRAKASRDPVLCPLQQPWPGQEPLRGCLVPRAGLHCKLGEQARVVWIRAVVEQTGEGKAGPRARPVPEGTLLMSLNHKVGHVSISAVGKRAQQAEVRFRGRVRQQEGRGG